VFSDSRTQLDIVINGINFSKRRGNKLQLFKLTAGEEYFVCNKTFFLFLVGFIPYCNFFFFFFWVFQNYTINTTTNTNTYTNVIDATSQPLTEDLLKPMFKSQFSDVPFTNRLFVEIGGKVNIDRIPTQDVCK
jgi:hypothetical protein